MPRTSATPTSVAVIPAEGFLRQVQIIGRLGVTREQAARNRKIVEAARKLGKKVTLPVCEQEAVQGIIPMCPTSWWEGVKSGRYPKSVKLGPRSTAWRVEDIRALIEQLGQRPALRAPTKGALRERTSNAVRIAKERPIKRRQPAIAQNLAAAT